jgi:hypothetical protein
LNIDAFKGFVIPVSFFLPSEVGEFTTPVQREGGAVKCLCGMWTFVRGSRKKKKDFFHFFDARRYLFTLS